MRIGATLNIGTILLALLGACGTADAEEPFRPITDSAKVQWADMGPQFPNTQMAVLEGDPSKPANFVFRFRCPDNYKILPHTHPGPETITVLEGAFHTGVGSTYDPAALAPVKRGGFFVIPAGTPHFCLCKGDTIIEVHATGPWEVKMLGAQ